MSLLWIYLTPYVPHLQLSASHWAEPNSRTLHIPLYCRAEPLNITETADLVIPFVSAPQNGLYYNIYRTYIGGVFRMMVVISASNLPCFLLSSLLYAICVVIKKYLGQVVSFCLKSCTALVFVVTPVFLAQSYQDAGGRFCSYWTKLENTTFPFRVWENRIIGGCHGYEIPSILVQPLYILVTRQCKCRLIWPPVGTAEPVPCVKSRLEAEKRH